MGHHRLTDEQHLRWATDHGRAIPTFDRQDFQDLAVDWFLRGDEHAGIIVTVAAPRPPVSILHHRLLRFLDETTADEMRNQIRWLDERWSSTE